MCIKHKHTKNNFFPVEFFQLWMFSRARRGPWIYVVDMFMFVLLLFFVVQCKVAQKNETEKLLLLIWWETNWWRDQKESQGKYTIWYTHIWHTNTYSLTDLLLNYEEIHWTFRTILSLIQQKSIQNCLFFLWCHLFTFFLFFFVELRWFWMQCRIGTLSQN